MLYLSPVQVLDKQGTKLSLHAFAVHTQVSAQEGKAQPYRRPPAIADPALEDAFTEADKYLANLQDRRLRPQVHASVKCVLPERPQTKFVDFAALALEHGRNRKARAKPKSAYTDQYAYLDDDDSDADYE